MGAFFMFLFYILLQVIVAWFYGHVLEYFLHKIMHDYKRFPFLFKHHFSVHHRISRQNEMRDESYDKIFEKSSLFELGGLSILLLTHLPVVFFLPFFYITIVGCMCQYYWIHRKSHINVEWGAKKLPWHYNHHLGKNQDANWGVTTDWVDSLLNTRIKYF